MTLFMRDQENIDKGRAEGRLEGRAEGRAEGRLEGRADAIEKLLTKGKSPKKSMNLWIIQWKKLKEQRSCFWLQQNNDKTEPRIGSQNAKNDAGFLQFFGTLPISSPFIDKVCKGLLYYMQG